MLPEREMDTPEQWAAEPGIPRDQGRVRLPIR